METENENRQRLIHALEKHIDKASEHKKYSVDRFDTLIITISTTALAFSIGFVKDFVKGNQNVEYSLLKTSWLILTFCIVINLLSQVTGYLANDYDISVTRSILREKRGKERVTNHDNMDKRCNILANITQILNVLSLVFLIIGLILLIISFGNNL